MAPTNSSITERDIVVIGASAGGVLALQDLVKGLPDSFKGSVFVVLHIPSYSETQLPAILSKAGPLEAVLAKDGDRIEQGKIYIAPNDHHLLLEEQKIVVVKGPKENRFRPSIDALFRSAAYVFGSRVIGVILSGLLSDGSSGLYTIKRQGGIVIIQDPTDAMMPQLPQNVLEYVEADYISKAGDMGPLIHTIVNSGPKKESSMSDEELSRLKNEVIIAKHAKGYELAIMNMGELTPFTCPECHGTLVRLVEGNILRFRCHTGHAYSATSLLQDVEESVEEMLWQSVRVLEEKAMLENEIANHLDKLNIQNATAFHDRADASLKRAQRLHDLVFTKEKDILQEALKDQIPG